MKASGVDLTVLRPDKTRYIPHVIEPSYGISRLVYVTMEYAYERKESNNEKRNIFRFPRDLAPYQISVQPLVTKDGLPELAIELHDTLLKTGYRAIYDEGGSIGRRYARQDEVGTPIAITIDYETKSNGLVTIRDRDTWKQVQVHIDELLNKLKMYFSGASFMDLGPIFE